jgi:hypothetical protein
MLRKVIVIQYSAILVLLSFFIGVFGGIGTMSSTANTGKNGNSISIP